LVNRREETVLAQARQESKAPELVLDRILHFSKTQFDSGLTQLVIQLRYRISSGDINARDRLGCYHQPSHRRRGPVDSPNHAVVKQLSICKKQWSIPTKKHKARN